jgi:hypothetical protein
MVAVNSTHILSAGAGFGVGAVLVGAVLFFATPRIAAAIQPQPSPAAYAAPSASPSAKSTPTPAQKAVNTAIAESLASSLGMTTKDLHKALHQGTTVQQLAGQKGISQATLQASFSQNLKSQLDHLVAAGTVPAAQESRVIARYKSTIPYWDKPPGQIRARAS